MTWSDVAEAALREAGWFPGRQVDLDQWCTRLTDVEGFAFHAEARLFLREFGGLTVDVRGPGVRIARTSFDLDPELCSGQRAWFADRGRDLGVVVSPIGEVDDGSAGLGIDDRGVVHILFDRETYRVGERGDALGRLIDGDY